MDAPSCLPIGVVSAPFRERFGLPRQAGLCPTTPARVELFSDRVDRQMLRGLEAASHVWLITWLHRARPLAGRSTVRPPRLGGNARLGALATRSPTRPNPLGLSAVRLHRIDGLTLFVLGADLVDGTPVLDVKPYLPWCDALPEASTPWADAPPERMRVRVSPQVELALAAAHVDANVRSALCEILALDPRPGYLRGHSAPRRHALEAFSLQVEFVVEGEELHWIGLRPAEGPAHDARADRPQAPASAAPGAAASVLPSARRVDAARVDDADHAAPRAEDPVTWFYEHYEDASAVGIHTTALLHREKSEFQAIEVYDTQAHGKLLTLDNMVMLTELDEFVYHELIVHIPMVIHPDPKAVLVVGGGDGGCVRELVKYPGLERVVQCEIDERVTRVCERYFPGVTSGLTDPRVELAFEDAVAYVERSVGQFDVILVDSTEPIGPAEALFRQPFLESLARALRPAGIVCAQAESPFYAPAVLERTFADYRRVFPHVRPYCGTVPTYPGGLWTFAFASLDAAPRAPSSTRLADPTALRWVTPRNLEAAFAVPAFVERLAGVPG